jgi:hypothetical protein
MPETPEDIARVKRTLGENATDEQILQYVATHARDTNEPLFMSPTSNAGIYGAYGKTAVVSRPYKLGKDRTKWF